MGDEEIRRDLIESDILPENTNGDMGGLAIQAYRTEDDRGNTSGVPSRVVGGALENQTHLPDCTATGEGRDLLARLDHFVDEGSRILHDRENPSPRT